MAKRSATKTPSKAARASKVVKKALAKVSSGVSKAKTSAKSTLERTKKKLVEGGQRASTRTPSPVKTAKPVKRRLAAKLLEKTTRPSKNARPAKRASKRRAGNAAGAAPMAAVPENASPELAVGSAVPDFELADANGKLVSSRDLTGKPYVLYFYPKDDTPGCTTQACGFRDALSRFARQGVQIIGVSPDSSSSHAKFRDKYGLNFSLLSDPEKELCKAFGVWAKKSNYGREYMGVERSTFFVDESGTIRKAWRRVRVPGHVDSVLNELGS
jgi:peroxiredoxin Q/BCP